MFFKMLKSDLKRKKGLSVILFIFIFVASALVFTGSVQIFSNLTSKKTAARLCRTSDMMFWTLDYRGDSREISENVRECLDSESNVIDWSSSVISRLTAESVDFPDFEEKEDSFLFRSRLQCLTTLPLEHDLLFDLDDKPFYVPNGCIAIPVQMVPSTGIRVGDKVNFVTDKGDVYELEVSCIFKDNSNSILRRYIVSEADYRVLSEGIVRRYNTYSVRLKDASTSRINELENKLEKQDIPLMTFGSSGGLNNDYVIMEIISVFIIIISVFLIAIIFMTIRFTMIADLKSEEKEIGMMKALGVDSLSFRWLFAAKYIAFAVVGGIIGIIAGLPVSAGVVNRFGPDSILPTRFEMVLIGALAVIAIIIMMILFSLFVMRRINRITVIDAIHGENRGERFSKGFPMFLHRRKRMSVPMFTALTDILGRFKRYIFLIIAYSLGGAILLLVFNVRNSVMDPGYTRYWLYHDYDFNIEFTDEENDRIVREMERTGKSYIDIINEKFSQAGIPAHIDCFRYGSGHISFDGDERYFRICWEKGEPEKFSYRKGGIAPKLENEAAISSYTAKEMDVHVGDVLKLTVFEYNEDHTDREENEREIIITGIIDTIEDGEPVIIMGSDYDKGFVIGYEWCGLVIDAPEKEKPAAVEKMRAMEGVESALIGREAMRNDISDFDELFFMLEFGVGGAVLLVMMLITYLYMSVFVAEEINETALMKSMGFMNSSIKAGYLMRILILLLISLVFAEIYIWTLGNVLFEMFMRQYEIMGMKFDFEFPVSFILIPLIIISAVLLTTLLTLNGVNKTDIWKISEE